MTNLQKKIRGKKKKRNIQQNIVRLKKQSLNDKFSTKKKMLQLTCQKKMLLIMC
jgi:hypothetical protein